MKRAKQIVMLGLLALGLLLLAAFVMNNLAPSPVGAAKRHFTERGWDERALSLMDYHVSATLGGSKASVQFSFKNTNQIQTIQIDLKKPIFHTKWKIVEIRSPNGQGVLAVD